MDTIYALSSGSVPSGIAVVRVSGPGASGILSNMCGALPVPRLASRRVVKRRSDGEVIDAALVLWFPAPASFTGEDCAEFHLHGGRAVLSALFDALAAQGARMAQPGEFTKRAFFNAKLDLTAAEGIADLIGAETEMQRRQALHQSGGVLAETAADWLERLTDLRAQLEASLDFSDEADVPSGLPADFGGRIDALRAEMRGALASALKGERIRIGYRVAVLGAPNAGKSTLVNALARRDVAIVTDEPGTTRDVLEVSLDLGGYPVTLFDTAGLRETDSSAEREGVRRARRAAEQADLVLWLIDPLGMEAEEPVVDCPVWRLATKADLLRGQGAGLDLAISAQAGTGLNELEERLRAAASAGLGGGVALVTRERQRIAIQDALACLEQIRGVPEEIAADLLRSASDAIGRLTGRVGIEQVLDRVFREFCIGK